MFILSLQFHGVLSTAFVHHDSAPLQCALQATRMTLLHLKARSNFVALAPPQCGMKVGEKSMYGSLEHTHEHLSKDMIFLS